MGRATDAAREILALDAAELPMCRDSRQIFAALRALELGTDNDAFSELVDNGFLAGAAERYHAYIEPQMRALGGATFDMGTSIGEARHFCGETPRHTVELSPFMLSAVAVTNEMYGLIDPTRRGLTENGKNSPVVGVTWFDCTVFAQWVGCRLPTEAEWEFACGACTGGQWCCPLTELTGYAWYSENADEHVRPVGTRAANALGLHDMHGNVWEWCQDTYSKDYYSRSPRRNPVNDITRDGQEFGDVHRVARGGGYLALAEMCRIRYRTHDPAAYSATDLGFRVARNNE